MRAKILTRSLICFFVFASCTSPADPEIEEALNPDPTTDVRYSCQIELTASVNTSANGTIRLSLDDSCRGFDFSPLPDNPSVSEGAISYWQIMPPGTHTLTFWLSSCILEPSYPVPSSWTVRMNVSSSNQDLVIIDGIQKLSLTTWEMEEYKTFTFSIASL